MSTKLFNAKGALASANLLGNNIGTEQAQALLKIKDAKPGLTTLCGLRGDETELDLSGKGLSSGCATLLAPELNANGALSKLTFGDGASGYIKKSDCSGASFEVGKPVIYQGKQCIVSKEVDIFGKLKVKFLAMLDASMTEVDLSGLNLDASGAIIAAAFLPRW